MSGNPVEADHPPVVAGDPADDGERPAGVEEPAALLDVGLEEPARERPLVRLAALAAGLLGAKHDHAERAPLPPDPLDRLERSHDAERAVELAAPRHRVQGESRSRPQAGSYRFPPAARPGFRCLLDLQAGLLHPAPGQIARLVLFPAEPGPVGSLRRRRSHCAIPLEPFEDALDHGAIIVEVFHIADLVLSET